VSTIIAKEQTGSTLPITQLPIPNQEIPAGGQVVLTDYATIAEIQDDDELKAYIEAGLVVLNDGLNDLSEEQSLSMVTTSTQQTALAGSFDQTYGLGASDGSLAGTTDTVYTVVYEPTKSMMLSEMEWYCVTGANDTIHVGIYNEARDTLLAYGQTVNPTSGTFNRVTLNASVMLSAGQKYWPAIMAESGGVAYAYSSVAPGVGVSKYTQWNQQNLPPTLNTGTSPSTFTPWFGFYGTQSTIVTEKSIFADYYDSGTTAVSSNATVLTLNTERQSNTAFSLSSNEVTVQPGGAGVYCVTYAVTFSESDPTIRVTQTWLEVNGTEVPATRGVVGHWATGGNGVDGTCGRTCILTLAESDSVRVMGQVTYNAAGYDTITGGVGLTIHSIGADGMPGPQGAQGPAGSGSTINLEENGSAVANTPHQTLNFVGLTVTDAGGGTANLTANTPVFGSNYTSAVDRTFRTTTSTSWFNVHTLNVALPRGLFRVEFNYVWSMDDTQNDFRCRVQVDNSLNLYEQTNGGSGSYNYHQQEPKDRGGTGDGGTDQRHVASFWADVEFEEAGNHAVEIDISSSVSNKRSSVHLTSIAVYQVS